MAFCCLAQRVNYSEKGNVNLKIRKIEHIFQVIIAHKSIIVSMSFANITALLWLLCQNEECFVSRSIGEKKAGFVYGKAGLQRLSDFVNADHHSACGKKQSSHWDAVWQSTQSGLINSSVAFLMHHTTWHFLLTPIHQMFFHSSARCIDDSVVYCVETVQALIRM